VIQLNLWQHFTMSQCAMERVLSNKLLLSDACDLAFQIGELNLWDLASSWWNRSWKNESVLLWKWQFIITLQCSRPLFYQLMSWL